MESLLDLELSPGGETTQLVLDLFIPYDSYMRNQELTADSTTTSGISTGDFFTVFNSNANHSRGTVVSLETDDTTRIGVTTDSIDNVYQGKRSDTKCQCGWCWCY